MDGSSPGALRGRKWGRLLLRAALAALAEANRASRQAVDLIELFAESSRGVEPMRFGDGLWVCPSWCEPPAGAAVVVRLDPGVAFGTGTHESTALCLEWLDAAGVAGLSVIDYGCGSGILGIAALALGARRVQAVDIDPQALAATADNAARNALAERITVHGPGEALEAADVVVANILAGPLVDLAPTLLTALRPGGRVALAGVTVEQLPRVWAAYEPAVAWRAPRCAGAWALAVGDAR